MSKASWICLIVLAGLVLAGCGGGTMPAGGDGTTQLTYQVTPDAGSTDPGSIGGETVEVTTALGSNGSELPDGFTAIQAMRFYPALPPGSGFTGTLNVRLSQITDGGYDGALLYLYYMDPATGEADFVDSCRAAGDWVNFQVNMLGYFIVAGNDAISSATDVFAAFAFADLTSVVIGEEINCWAVAVNGTAPYTFEWWMGDGETVSGDSVSYGYQTPGEYNIRVTVTDATGAHTAAYSTPVSVAAGGGPQVDDLGVERGTVEPELDFTYTASISGGVPPYTYEWDFNGDGATDSTDEPPVSYAFSTYGFYEGILEVTDSIGQSVIQNFVSDARNLGLYSDNTNGLAPYIAEFEVYVEGLINGETITIDFGDDTTADLTTTGAPTLYTAHTYESAGVYHAQAASTRTVGGEDYIVDSESVTVNVSLMSTSPYIQLTQPIVPLFEQDMTLHGYNFGDTPGDLVVSLDGLTLNVMSWSDTAIMVEYPESFNDTQGSLSILDDAAPVSNPVVITFDTETHPAAVQNIIPQRIEPGGRVFVVGHGFGDTAVSVDIADVPVTVDGWSESAITGIVGETVPLGTQSLYIDLAQDPLDLTVEIVDPTGGFPLLTSINPTPYTVGGTGDLTLTGGALGNDPAGCIVFADAFVLPYDTWSDTQVVLNGPLPSVDSFAVVVNHQRCSNPEDMLIYGMPQIEALDPPYGAVGDQFSVLGHSFGTQDSGDRVLLGTVELTVVDWITGRIIVELPAGVVDGDIVVEKFLTSNAVPFDVLPPSPGQPDGGQI